MNIWNPDSSESFFLQSKFTTMFPTPPTWLFPEYGTFPLSQLPKSIIKGAGIEGFPTDVNISVLGCALHQEINKKIISRYVPVMGLWKYIPYSPCIPTTIRRTCMKYAGPLALFALICSLPINAQQAPEGWSQWKAEILASTETLELREVLVTDYDENLQEIRKRRVSPKMASRNFAGAGSSLSEEMSIETLPGMYFTIPWDYTKSRSIEQPGRSGAVGIEMFADGQRQVRGEIWYGRRSGELIESSLSFDGNDLPRIQVNYADNQIDSIIIRTVPAPGLFSADFRDVLFIY